MLLKTHEELRQHTGETVIFSSNVYGNAPNLVGMLWFDTTSNCEAIYLLSNDLNGAKSSSEEWKRHGYKYSWRISYNRKHYEEDNRGVLTISAVSIDFNKLEELLC